MRSNTSADSSTLTFVLAGGRGKRLSPFTLGTPKPLVPFGGAFRIIDFTLSNCVNSGLERAYLLTQYKSDSIRQYIENASWPTDFVCVPPRPSGNYHGTADAVYQNMDRFRHQRAEQVLLLASDHIYKMDYRKLIAFHAAHGGDATIAVVRTPRRLAGELGVVEVDERGRVVAFAEKPQGSAAWPTGFSSVTASMGVYVFNASILRHALLRDAGNFGGTHEIGNDIIPNLIRTHRVFAYDFTANDAPQCNYWRDVGTIDSYHRTQMELLVVNSPFDPYNDARWPIYAGGRDVLYRRGPGASSWIVDSIVAPDAEVTGATILQSVISPGVRVASTAQVQGSVLMRNVSVGRDALVRHAIVDEGVSIPDGERIGCDPVEDRRRFFVTENGVVAVYAGNASALRHMRASRETRSGQALRT